MEKAVIAAGLTGALWLADYGLGFTHDLGMQKSGLRALEYLLREEAAGRASVVEPFITTARGANANKDFLVFEDHIYSFKDVDIETNRITQLLSSSGVKPGSCVSILFQNSPQAVMAQIAVLKLGAAVSFLNFNLRGAPLLHTFKLGQSNILFFEDTNHDAVESILADLPADIKLISYGFRAPSAEGPFRGKNLTGIDAETLARDFPDGMLDPGIEVRKSIRLNSWCGIYFTSGTTGLPKAAYQVHNRWRAFPATIGVGYRYFVSSDRVLCPLPLYHGSAQVSLNACMLVGSTYIFTRKFSASGFWKEAIRTRATVMHHIGESARFVLAQPPSPLDRAHTVTKAIGNGLRLDVWGPLMKRFGIQQVFEWYGASEGAVGMFHIQKGWDGIGCIGRVGYLARWNPTWKLVKIDPITEELIRDPKTGFAIACGFNEPGELYGPILPPEASPVKVSNFDGYFGDQKATEKKIRRDVFQKGDTWMAMGDLLTMDRRGWVRFVDRIGDTFRWKSENVATTEVANELQGFPEMLEANVFGVEVPGHDGRAGMAAITLRDDVDQSTENVKELMKRLGTFATAKLPGYAVPKFVRVMSQMEHRKVDYVKQGFNPNNVPEPLYWYSSDTKHYETLGQAEYRAVIAGRAKL